MIITIQRQDYSAALDALRALTIERKLNAPSLCELWLTLPASGSLPMPVRNQRLAVSGDSGTLYFTGYIAVTPLPEYAGLGIEGPRYRIAIQALSDELLLDQLLMPPSAGAAGSTAGALIAALVTRTGSAALSTSGLTLASAIGSFAPLPGASWSASAGQVASQAMSTGTARKALIVLDCIILRLDRQKGISVTDDSAFL